MTDHQLSAAILGAVLGLLVVVLVSSVVSIHGVAFYLVGSVVVLLCATGCALGFSPHPRR
jgi:uncharacterized protein YacL